MAGRFISAAVEGPFDEIVATRLIAECGGECGPAVSKGGKPNLRRRIGGFREAAKHSPWFVLVDLDREFECAPELVNEWLTSTPALLCFRVAVRSVESWLLADRAAFAQFIGVSQTRIPGRPDELEYPKQELINVARRSRRRSVIEDIVPRSGSGSPVGPAYNLTLGEFAKRSWSPDRAAAASPSLSACLAALRRLIRQAPIAEL